jgi:hypothetical protein
MRLHLEPSGTLYDKLHISHTGYAGAVPIAHKSAAVSELIAQMPIDADDDLEQPRPCPGRKTRTASIQKNCPYSFVRARALLSIG